ncbi:DUF2851 family protein [Maribacter hydrothermalis]|uniref:DUF2851 domain-containing protein n=1 Tax=Maribacter hydrothermalis TaxID=1836467 RepID=A0A1B7ZBB5_9FLAO|nr:DUF2851 family protein [Maribacter hydrothermalis]APQ16437.1 hypothetical protein BTR34_03405 [Maribacter hydrothermalis]OBR40001.1 hypothetical protein A9200_17005 [Maribacter hydrothermalis]
MREDLLHFMWMYRKYPINGLVTETGDTIEVESTGIHNHLSGPDFFNAKLRLNGQLWAGNVEIHIKSSDWYAHKHQDDCNYDNVILHVVWEDDISVFRKDGSQIPTLSLKEYISEELLKTYKTLLDSKNYKFINCEKEFHTINEFVKNNWLDRLFIERLEQKSLLINQLLSYTNNDWEHVLFLMLLKNFGSKINGDNFIELGKTIDFPIIRKLQNKPLALESLFMGQARLLENDQVKDAYQDSLLKEYIFLKNKFSLNTPFKAPDFFKLRPHNFPTIRLAQLSAIYSSNSNLFHLLIEEDHPNMAEVFNVGTSEYWETHFNFGKTSKKSIKRISNSFLDLIIINTIIPLKFCFQSYKGTFDHEKLFQDLSYVKKEDNSIILNFRKLNASIKDAKDSQSYIQLYNEYCVKDKCLDCVIGGALMNIKG